MAILEVHSLRKNFGALKAVDDVSFSVEEQSIVGLIGPNGAGKTTLFNLITGFIIPDSGKVIFQGKDITKSKPNQRTTKGLSRTFQGTQVFSDLPVWQNVMISRFGFIKPNIFTSLLGNKSTKLKRLEAKDWIKMQLEKYDLGHRWEEKAKDIPFLEQGLLSLVMAVSLQPKILFLDEPLAGLNTEESELIIELIRKIRDSGTTIVLIEHHMKALMTVSEKVIVLHHGNKIAEGPPIEIQNNETVIQAYLGKSMKKELSIK